MERGGDARDWLEEWKVHTRLLRSALRSGMPDDELKKLLSDCFLQYSRYLSLRASPSVGERRLPSLGTPLEAVFTWLGGWRPSSAIVMVASLLREEIGVVSAAITSDQSTCFLSQEQLTLLEPLQNEIRQSELDFSQQLSLFQMLVSDQSMLSALILRSGPSSGTETVRGIMETKVAALKGLLEQADKLRLQTLEELFKILTPVQAARASLAAFEIVSMMRSMGNNSTLMRSMSASEATFEMPIRMDLIPTIQNLVVPMHAGLALEESVIPVTLSFPIVPTELTGAVGIQSAVSTVSGVDYNPDGYRPDTRLTLLGPSIPPHTTVERTMQTTAHTSSPPRREALIGTGALDNLSNTSDQAIPPSAQAKKDVLPSSKRPHPGL